MDIGFARRKVVDSAGDDEMAIRIGRVTSVYPSEGRVKVAYEDSRSSSLPLPMMALNQEYSMPKVGDRVVTLHMDNGSSKGFVLGNYYGGGSQPKANTGYRKDYDGAYLVCTGGHYQLQTGQFTLNADSLITLKSDDAELILDSACVIKAQSVSVEADDITLKCSYGEITVEDLMKRLERIEDQLGLPHTI